MEQRKAFEFRCPTRLLIAGPSGCGKTTFTTRLLLDNTELFSKAPESIYYCYGSWQKGFEKLKQGGVKFHEGIPDTDLLRKWFPGGQGILVLDDLMDEGSNDKRVLDLFTRDSHHQGVTVLYLCQDLISRQDHLLQRALHCSLQEPTRSTGDAEPVTAIVSHPMARRPGNVSESDRASIRLHAIGRSPRQSG